MTAGLTPGPTDGPQHRYRALATDYDSTLAHEGRVDAQTVAALRRCKSSGRRLILVTGRELSDLRGVFPELGIFDRVVAENGAVIHRPENGSSELLGPAPPPTFLEALRRLGATPVAAGRVIVATRRPHEVEAGRAAAALGLDLRIVFNKASVMILPPGIDKATGLARALAELGLSLADVVGVGDAENDVPFLAACACAAVVGNALPDLRASADLVLARYGQGVIELVDGLLEDDLSSVRPRPRG